MKRHYHKIKKHPQTQRVLQNKKFQKYEKWLLLIFWAGIIYFLSSRQLAFIAATDNWELWIRKLGHMFVFGILAFLIFRVLQYTEKRHVYWNLAWAFVFAVLYAISDEYHQSLVPGRFGTYQDVLIDTIGIIIATWLIYLYYHHERVRQIKYQTRQKSPE